MYWSSALRFKRYWSKTWLFVSSLLFTTEVYFGVSMMVERVKVLAAKPDDLRTDMVKERTNSHKQSADLHTYGMYACIYTYNTHK